MSKATKDIVFGEELQTSIAEGIRKVYEVARAAYGPMAGNALLELPYGDPLISRDGVTNVEKVYLKNPVENMAARIVVQASRKNNRKVGDGTTAAVILAYHLYNAASTMLYAGFNRMQVAKLLEQTAYEVIKQIDDMKQPITEELLRYVAIVSAGDEAIGRMIADVIENVGTDGGVTVEDFAGVGIYNELVDGFYFRKGFTNVNLTNDPSNLESRHQDVDIFITEKRMATVADLAPILEKIVISAGKGKELVIVGDVSEEVLGMLLLNRMNGTLNTTVVDMPVFGAMRSLALEDLALITGGKVYLPGANPQDFSLEMLGSAKRVIVNEFSTTVIGGEGASEDVETRITDLRKQLNEAESPITASALQERLSRLTGKVAIIRVGGATEVEQGEVKLRVQDAICAVQAAIKDGIVPGGGVALARTNPKYFKDTFIQLFKELVKNAGYDANQAFWKMNKKNTWYGFNLREDISKIAYRPVDLLEAGVIDPASVVKEVVRNATSVVSKLITAEVGVIYADREQKHD